jgi:hypothetical protein
MVPQSETRRCAGTRYLKLIDNLFPQFAGADLNRSSSDVDRLVKLAKIQFFPANRRHFKVVVPELPLELNQVILKLVALSAFILFVKKLQRLGHLINN